jgi:hypothetical protein
MTVGIGYTHSLSFLRRKPFVIPHKSAPPPLRAIVVRKVRAGDRRAVEALLAAAPVGEAAHFCGEI